jgi:ATP-dependent DNA helicase RecG
MAKKLASMGIYSISQLLFHLPLRYEDRSQVVAIASLRNGMRTGVEAEVIDSKLQFGKRRSLLCKVSDGSGTLSLRFFYFSKTQQQQLCPGARLYCFGEVSLSNKGLGMIHPEYRLLNTENPVTTAAPHTAPGEATLTAVYPSTEGIQQSRWRQFIASAFKVYASESLTDLLSADDLQTMGLDSQTSLFDALKLLHFPPVTADITRIEEGHHPLQRRLAFEELIAQRLSHLRVKSTATAVAAKIITTDNTLESHFLQQLPFALTGAQQRAMRIILTDMSKPQAMMRLLQGDVGSGKTLVAAIAALHCAANALQTVIMAPTEILAEQHAQSMQALFRPLGIEVGLLTSKLPSAEKLAALQAIADGSTSIVIGTHALIQEAVEFSDLGLVIIDEQHRFGVDQRRILQNKRRDGLGVHQLVMTATPIPRTLAMTFYADLDYAVIDELPPGRKPVATVAISNDKRSDVIARVHNACSEQRQVYWVCTLIEESEELQCQAAETVANQLTAALPDTRIGLVHGRLKPAQKQQVMQAFKRGDIQLLVATTVIEVGVDVPNASLMIIENPERLGLAQLHQLRGRVGRGSTISHCVLMYQKPLSQKGRQRLDILRQTNDGFKLAEADLQMRGAGELLGTRQSGAATMKLADLERDADMIDTVVSVSDRIFQMDPSKCEMLIQRWCPDASKYGNV